MLDALFSTRYVISARALPGEAQTCVADIEPRDWIRVAQTIRAEGGRLIAIWASDRKSADESCVVSAAYCVAEGLLWLRLSVDEEQGYPDLSIIFPSAVRMQRSVYDLLGLRAERAPDYRPWLNHGKWPRDYFPLRWQCSGQETFARDVEKYPFVTVEGEGVHEIAVGPIHAGIIEPGHFRFSVVGEKVLRLEQRHGYTHKGIEKLFTHRTLADGHQLAGRISGDSTVAFCWAYSMAVEEICYCQIPARGQWLRALLLERERVANHLGDLGALGNDAGLAVGLAQFSRIKEDWVRLSGSLFGHRFMMDCVIPGGVTVDLDADGVNSLVKQCDNIEKEVDALRHLYEEHAGLQDRFISTGRVVPKLAAELGLCGLAGRASGQAFDVRADQTIVPYAELSVKMCTHRNGDVAARVIVRFEEIGESLRLIREIANRLPGGVVATDVPPPSEDRMGAGWIEGWRGPVFVAIESDGQGNIRRCHCHDSSWQNWPILEHAIMGNIVPDFPLINKSFNLSYSGYDL